MEPPKERVFRGYLSSADVERLYPARVARIARGELTYAERGRINEEVSRIDREWRAGHFNGVEYFHFRFPEQGARMAVLPDEETAASARAGKQRGADSGGGGRGVGATGRGTRNDPGLA